MRPYPARPRYTCRRCCGAGHCTSYQVLAFTRALQDAGVDWRAHVYVGAKHAFWA
ncbi:MAG: Dienelactone hydrolase, partial [Pseudonocardia sp.]|nr:Dienelactone hydrolase [Pseudonocardia sp.]